jgi:hypothetical protein
MQDEEKFQKSIGNNIKEIVYIKVNELDRTNMDFKNENIGIAIVRTERYGKASMIVGSYDLENSTINDANVFTRNLNVAKEASIKYKGLLREINTKENGAMYMVNLSEPVKIDVAIKGEYR